MKICLKIGDRFDGLTKDGGIKNPTDQPLVLKIYQGWNVGYRELVLPPHSATKLLSPSSPACCARLEVIALE